MADKTPRAWDGALEQEFYTPEEIAASDARVGKAHRMLYREKVIEGLKFTLEESGWDANAAYDQELMIQAVADALALLKEQEPVEPIFDYDGRDVWRCGNCHRNIFHPTRTDEDENEKNYRRFCFHCGREVKWK